MSEEQEFKKFTIRVPSDIHKDFKTICFHMEKTINQTLVDLMKAFVNAKREKFKEKLDK